MCDEYDVATSDTVDLSLFAFATDERDDHDDATNENDDIHSMREYMIMLTWVKGVDYD